MPEIGILDNFKRLVTVGNLDPGDGLLRVLTPGMIVEHQQRYRFASGEFPPQAKILDLASGRGYGSGILNEKGNRTVIGLDLGKKYVKKAAEKYGQEAEFGVADVRKLPIKEASIDGITAFEITEHLEKDDQLGLIREMARVLKPGGKAIISIPHCYSSSRKTGNVYHFYEPSPEELKQMIRTAGLTLEEPERGQVVCFEGQAADLRSRLNKPLNRKTFKYWFEGEKGKQTVADFFQVREAPKENGKTTLTHIFVVKK